MCSIINSSSSSRTTCRRRRVDRRWRVYRAGAGPHAGRNGELASGGLPPARRGDGYNSAIR